MSKKCKNCGHPEGFEKNIVGLKKWLCGCACHKTNCSEHEWITETLREPTFKVAYGSIRTCKKCGKVQFADWTKGRIGGDWMDAPESYYKKKR